MRPKRHAGKPRALIVSLWHVPFHVTRNYQNYCVPAREENGLLITSPKFCETYGSLLIDAASCSMDIGDRRGVPQEFDAYAIADDIVATEELFKFGVFVPDEDEPRLDALQAAQGLLIRRAKSLVQEGDTKYSKMQTRAEVNDLNRWAVIQLGEQREWVYQNELGVKEPMPRCEACGVVQQIPNPAMCWSCKTIINVEKALKLNLPVPEGMLVGHPKKPLYGAALAASQKKVQDANPPSGA